MNINTPIKGSLSGNRGYHNKRQSRAFNPSFQGNAKTIITAARDKEIMQVFSQHYGNIGDRIGEKLYKLSNESDFIRKSSRFSTEKGTLSIEDKKISHSIMENIIFPFVTLPLYGASALLKKAQSIPALSKKAKDLYNKPIFRTPRKLNEADSKTDILKGMFEKTQQTIERFAKEKGMKSDELLHILAAPKKHPDKKELIEEANKNIKESLYKVSNKFFDKHTGNFNTAYERPLNRLITGAIPVAFLANDAYNLSVLCGDSKETSEKEADVRKKQEIIRIFTTAYIQLLMFGAFAKQVNTLPWFAPAMSAATVLASEILSRKKMDRPIFFLSKESAQEYNKKHGIENENQKNHSIENSDKEKQIKTSYGNFEGKSSIFKGFNKSAKTYYPQDISKRENKKEQKTALINFDTFKKGVIILTGMFFGLNFLKNSSLTKNSAIIQGMKDFGKYLTEKIYNPLAYKDFEMTREKFDSVMGSLQKVGCEKVAQGHEFIKGKYAKETENGMIKIYKSSLDAEGIKKTTAKTIEKAKQINPELTKEEIKTIEEAIKTAIRLNKSNIAENNYSEAAKKALEIARNKKINFNEQQITVLEKELEKSMQANAKESAIKIATKLKPFVDIVTEPFKFIYSAARLPFKLATSGINLIVKPVETKAAKAALGQAQLSKFEQGIHKAVTEIFGEKQGKDGKISQVVFANAMEQLEKKTLPYRNAQQELNEAIKSGKSSQEIEKLQKILENEKHELMVYVNNSVEKSFNGVTQSSNKNTDLALMSKLASSTVTSAFLVADNYNMVMMKSNGEDKEEAKEKANERIIQRLSGLFYQALFINWFNATFRSTYNSSLMGMTAVAIPNTLTTEILTRKSIGMPVGRMTLDELNEMDAENENRTGITGKYFEFMRLLTGKKPLKERLPKEKQQINNGYETQKRIELAQTNTTNIIEMLSKK